MLLFNQPLRSCWLLIVLMCLAGSAAWAQGRIECGSVQSKILNAAVRYCALLPPSYDASTPAQGTQPVRRFPVLYYLHGLGDSERSLIDTGGWNLIQDLAEQHKIGDFLIVTPQGGRTFYINSRDGKTRYSDFFLSEFIPTIERRYRVRTERSARGIMGISMGGYGALRFAFANPQLFVAASAHSAALMPESPEALNQAATAGMRRTDLLGDVFGYPIDAQFWRKNSPLVLARKNAAAISRLKIYFDCGTEDPYGFDRGAKALHDELVAEKISHEFHLYPGEHNLIYFLQHLGASIEFHSHAFEASR
jgi:S-formylglutathione hydrolase FrmB